MENNLILIFLAVSYLTASSTQVSTDESTLLSFRARITSDPNKILTKNWTQGTLFCNWVGVTCGGGLKDQRVTGLNLANMGLEGTISKEIGRLPFLDSLVISNNSFHGIIPEEIGNLSRLVLLEMQFNELNGPIPTTFGLLGNLQKLNLSRNNLIGELPSTIFNMSSLHEIGVFLNAISGEFPGNPCSRATKLERILLYSNQFHGEILSSLLHCQALKELDISRNNFTGIIPNEIGNLSAIQMLILRNNAFTGTVPSSIGNISTLERFDITSNNIHGNIPPELGFLPSLKGIYFSINFLDGEIPQSIFNISELQVLNLVENDLSGYLPSLINHGVPNLEGLYLGGNRFSGEIPSSISNLSRLTWLELSLNSFCGNVPMNLGNLRTLQVLGLSDNLLTNDPSMMELGFLTSLTNCRQLKYLKFGGNPLDGVLPASLGSGNLSASLQRFRANDCGLKGMIPPEIGNLTSLILLNMGTNSLAGTIPKSLGQLRSVQRFRMDGNELHGSIPVNFCTLKNLYQLSLQQNNLSGELPSCLGNITLLREIYLEYNALTSTIPFTLWTNKEIHILSLSQNLFFGYLDPEIGSFKSMRELDLSGNGFLGEIPSTFTELHSLVYLNLSSNRLNGSIPLSFGDLMSDLQYLDLSMNNLSGEIPKSLEKLEYLVYFNVSYNELIGEIPNEGPFKKFTADSFTGNKKLCGASRFKVKPCSSTSNTSRSTRASVWIYITLSVALLAIVSTTVIIVLLIRNRNRHKSPLRTLSFTVLNRISYYELVHATNNFDRENLIGRGSMGSVYKGTFSDGLIAAIKVFDLDVEGAFNSFDAECQIMCNVRHRNLVKVISSCSNYDFKALVMEYLPNGSLDNWLYSSNLYANIIQVLEIMIDVASALKYLHQDYSYPIVHCDLKPSNILLDEDLVAHVGDFGIAKLLTDDNLMSRTETLGTVGYMAPEYGSTGLVSTMVDVYSYGILLMELLTRKKPTDEMFLGELTLKRWVSKSYPDAIMSIIGVHIFVSDEENIMAKQIWFTSIVRVALECTSDLPGERPDMKEVIVRLNNIVTKLHTCTR